MIEFLLALLFSVCVGCVLLYIFNKIDEVF
jgi:hypothetical protein